MVTDTSLLQSANHLLDRQWRRWRRHAHPQHCSAVSPAKLRVMAAILTDLVDVVSDQPQESIDQFEPMVRRLVYERSFTDHGCDAVGDDGDRECDVEAQVKIILHVLQSVREKGLERGSWCGYEAPPPMCG